MKKNLIFVVILTLLFSCKNDNKVEHVERAFYYWKSGNSLSTYQEDKLNANSVTKIYVKYFEVNYSETVGNFPSDKLYSYGEMFQSVRNVSIVPTIFVKNEIFKFNTEKDLDKLADDIVFLIDKRSKEKFEKIKVDNEIQIDCDWTKSTKDKYFYLLKKIKEKSKKQISCTLRLYPYKYQDIMGVPPVDKATLMCYNLVQPLTEKDKNSILDIKELKLYLNEKRSYPVHLDIALPVFSWSQLYQNNYFQKLVNISSVQLKTFAKEIKPMWFEVEKDTSLDWGNYYRIGDQIKCEEVSAETLQQAIALIKKNVELDKTTTITLFDLDDSTFNTYTDEELSNFYTAFSK